MKKLKWKSFKISALAELRNGGTPPKNEAKFWGGSIPFITAADLTEAVLKDGRSYVTRAGLESGKTVICEPGDLLIGTRTRVGQCSVAGKLMAASQDITRARINGGASAEYLLLFFRHLAGYLSFHSQGTSIQGITREVLEGVDVPVPSAEEQKRLVKKVSSVVARANQLAEHTQALASDIQRAVASFYDRLAAECDNMPSCS